MNLGKTAKKSECATVSSNKKESYACYIYKVLKQCSPNIGISRKAMNMIEFYIHNIFERIAREAGLLARYNKKHTIGHLEIQNAVKLVFPGELMKHAIFQGEKAVTKYNSNKKV